MQDKSRAKRSYGSGSFIEKGGSVHFRFWVNGKRKQEKIGPAGMGTKEREAAARKLQAGYRPIEDSGIPNFSAVGYMHVRQLELDGKKLSYTRNRSRTLVNYLIPEFGDRPVDQIKAKDLGRFKTKLQNDGKGPSTIISVLWLASGIFKFAIEEEWRTDNPMAGVKMPEYDRPDEIAYFTIAEFEAIMRAIPDDELGEVERYLYPFYFQTGARRGEGIALKWTDLKWTSWAIQIVRNLVEGDVTAPKSGKGRYVPMTQKLGKLLDEWSKKTIYNRDSDYVFTDPRTGMPLRSELVSKRFKRAILKAGVGPVEMREYKVRCNVVKKPFPLMTLHQLRDSFATHIIMNPKTSIRELQEWLGHANAVTTSERYAGFQPKTDAAERIEESFAVDHPIVTQSEATSPNVEDLQQT